jgi:RNA polymerase sigma-70 factor (ECF subfamily)
MTNSTSESLLCRLKDSDNSEAWSKFTELYTPLIFFWARKNGLDAHDASDLVQEVMTLVFQKLPEFQYDPNRSFRGWLRQVTLNKHRERLRKKKLNFDAVSQTHLSNLPLNGKAEAAGQTWDQDYCRNLVASAIDLMRKEFAPQTWEALKQFVSTGKTAQEISHTTGVSTSTIYAAKSRLMKRLRQDLEGLME